MCLFISLCSPVALVEEKESLGSLTHYCTGLNHNQLHEMRMKLVTHYGMALTAVALRVRLNVIAEEEYQVCHNAALQELND